MHKAWNKGLTKTTSASVRKIAATMRVKKIDNFAEWRKRMKVLGVIKSTYPPLKKNGDLAELVGVILGDGYIGAFPRTEVLRIVGSANNEGFIKRYSTLVEKIFLKVPAVKKRNSSEAVDITIYEKCIAKRLGMQTGAKTHVPLPMPKWISSNRSYTIRYLRGLYEAEGSISHHEKTYTHKFQFANTHSSLLDNVFDSLVALGFHPHRSKKQIQISRKEEVQNLKNLLEFRVYEG
jgi:DNA-binding transcriptional regulator WhiA